MFTSSSLTSRWSLMNYQFISIRSVETSRRRGSCSRSDGLVNWRNRFGRDSLNSFVNHELNLDLSRVYSPSWICHSSDFFSHSNRWLISERSLRIRSIMHSMVGAFSPYTVKRRRAEIVRGYCYRFIQCSFPCGLIMLIISLLFILVGTSQLIYIIHFNGCQSGSATESETNVNQPPSSRLPFTSAWKCNRQTIKVIGITLVVTGSVAFLISLVITKYSRSGEENNVIRTTTSSLLAKHSKKTASPSGPLSTQNYYTPTSSINDPNNVVVSLR